MPSPLSARAVALLALSSSIACGGTVVFEEGGGGDGAGSPAGSGGASAVDAVAIAASGTGGASSTDVAVSASAVTSGGGDGGAPSGPVGPGPAGPGPGGGAPAGGGAPPGPGGVGGADVGGVAPSASVSAASGCSGTSESTNQHCYAAELCGDYRLELECEINGGGPWTCWCYQDGQYRGSCTEVDVPGCSFGGCCESYWVLPG